MAEIRIALPYPLDSDKNIKLFQDAINDFFPKDSRNVYAKYTLMFNMFSSQDFNSYSDLRNFIYGKENLPLRMIFLSYSERGAVVPNLTLQYCDFQKEFITLSSDNIEYLENAAESIENKLHIKPQKSEIEAKEVEQPLKAEKKKKIFISHATKDCEYAKQLVNLLVHMGIRETDQIFCSSIGGTGIPLREHIYNHIKQEFQQFDIYVIMLLSENYYNSPACLNEMGATWILDLPDMPILLPGFSFSRIEGAEDNRRIAIKLDADDISEKLLEFRDTITTFFDIAHTNSASEINIWSRHQKEFIDAVTEIAKNPK